MNSKDKYMQTVNKTLVDMTSQEKGLLSAISTGNQTVKLKAFKQFVIDFNTCMRCIQSALYHQGNLVSSAFRALMNMQIHEQYVDRNREQRLVDDFVHGRVNAKLRQFDDNCAWVMETPAFKTFVADNHLNTSPKPTPEMLAISKKLKIEHKFSLNKKAQATSANKGNGK